MWSRLVVGGRVAVGMGWDGIGLGGYTHALTRIDAHDATHGWTDGALELDGWATFSCQLPSVRPQPF